MNLSSQNEDIFLFDSWKDFKALGYLIGIIVIEGEEAPTSLMFTLDGKVIDEFDENTNKRNQSFLSYEPQLIRIKEIWGSGNHSKTNPPAYYIDWALSKNINIPWLNWAIDKGYYQPKDESPIDKPLLSRERSTLLRIIAALTETLVKKDANEKDKPLFKSQAELISYIEDTYGDYEGLKKSTLEEKIALGNKQLQFN